MQGCTRHLPLLTPFLLYAACLQRRLAAEKSAREADIAAHTAVFAHHAGEKKLAQSNAEGAKRQAEADAKALRKAERAAAAQ